MTAVTPAQRGRTAAARNQILYRAWACEQALAAAARRPSGRLGLSELALLGAAARHSALAFELAPEAVSKAVRS
ncbi:hypothetical protein [Tahibacter harae]|uniref:MarR family transcriptional regulator n=1 Tax=Tahibacter harae TaxID=2963937 RepID=A0ABT1QS32_9GAMM|nr:hypothetical protein [Tahibacter harae]MCQ4165112.1 hypothetical protein [Tahibacter harae]